MNSGFQKFLNLVFIGLICTLTGCSNQSASFDKTSFVKGEEVVAFNSKEDDDKVSYVSHGYSNRGMFLSTWSKERIRYDNGIGYLSILDEDDVNYGAELRTQQGYLYGYFGARIKTFKHPGTVQSIFTYNGGWNYIWDEIDIEFLGKDTTRVQFNYYSNGKGGHEYWYDLGFDSSEDFHDYGFKWEEDKITWYVDFIPVYAQKAKLGQWGRFFINVWAGNESAYNWLGEYQKTDVPLEAAYDYMCYSPLQ